MEEFLEFQIINKFVELRVGYSIKLVEINRENIFYKVSLFRDGKTKSLYLDVYETPSLLHLFFNLFIDYFSGIEKIKDSEDVLFIFERNSSLEDILCKEEIEQFDDIFHQYIIYKLNQVGKK